MNTQFIPYTQGHGHTPKMNSLEIAELVQSRHDSVKRSIERLSESGVISLPPLEEVKIQRERREEGVIVYVFTGEQGRRDSTVVVAQICPEFTARLVDRWMALEQQATLAQFNVPKTYKEALLLAVRQQEQIEQLEATSRDMGEQVSHLAGVVKEQSIKVAGFDRIAGSSGDCCITDAAKALKLNPKVLFGYLSEHHWIYRRDKASPWIGHQTRLDSGRLMHRTVSVLKGDGSHKTYISVRVTAKGLAALSKAFSMAA